MGQNMNQKMVQYSISQFLYHQNLIIWVFFYSTVDKYYFLIVSTKLSNWKYCLFEIIYSNSVLFKIFVKASITTNIIVKTVIKAISRVISLYW
jgi:hypothetical protein